MSGSFLNSLDGIGRRHGRGLHDRLGFFFDDGLGLRLRGDQFGAELALHRDFFAQALRERGLDAALHVVQKNDSVCSCSESGNRTRNLPSANPAHSPRSSQANRIGDSAGKRRGNLAPQGIVANWPGSHGGRGCHRPQIGEDPADAATDAAGAANSDGGSSATRDETGGSGDEGTGAGSGGSSKRAAGCGTGAGAGFDAGVEMGAGRGAFAGRCGGASPPPMATSVSITSLRLASPRRWTALMIATSK